MARTKARSRPLRCSAACKSGMLNKIKRRDSVDQYTNNRQFVDPLILMRILWIEARRRVSSVIAAKSMGRRFVGTVSGWFGSIPVGRALDLAKPGTGKIYLPRPMDDPLVVRGVGTDFEKQAQKGGLLVLPTINKNTGQAEIAEVLGPGKIRLKKEFKGEDAMKQLTGMNGLGGSKDLKLVDGYEGTAYKIAPKVDQSKAYDAVFASLKSGGCVCIFPEGGSHDRTELLPLKPGVAIMALGSLAESPDSGLKIVPCGMNYFHAHKFRSRAVVEFGTPMEVSHELQDLYRSGEKREATRQLLEQIYQGLLAVTVTSPDYDTLMVIQAVRRLYKPKGKQLPLPMIIELNRRLALGYQHYKDEPRVVNLKKEVTAYNQKLWLLGIRDHQVENAKLSTPVILFRLVYRLMKLALLTIGTLPGLILFAPVFVAAKAISIKKSREALAASTVKLQGRDVVATWKLLVAMVVSPLVYTFYALCLLWWAYENRVQGWVPGWVPLWTAFPLGYIVFPMVTFAALRIGEIGMDILKSLPPLVLCLNPTSSNTLVKLRKKRVHLIHEVTELINTFGPELFDDFEHARLVTDPFKQGAVQDPDSPESLTLPREPQRSTSTKIQGEDAGLVDRPIVERNEPSLAHDPLPRNESFHDISNMGIFASRPASRSRSRPGSQGGASAFKGLTMTTKENLDEVSKRIRGAMHERGKQRERTRSEGSWELTGSGTETPGSEEVKKDI